MWNKAGQPLKESQLVTKHGKNAEERKLLCLALDDLLASGLIIKYQETGKDELVYRLTEKGKEEGGRR